MKNMFIAGLISLLLMGCSQPDSQELEASVPIDEAAEIVEVTEPTISEPLSSQEKVIIPKEEQTVQVTFTQEALEQISQDLDNPDNRNKVLKIKPAID